MIDTYFRDNILKKLDEIKPEIDRDSFNLSISEQNELKIKIEELKKFICDYYAIKYLRHGNTGRYE